MAPSLIAYQAVAGATRRASAHSTVPARRNGTAFHRPRASDKVACGKLIPIIVPPLERALEHEHALLAYAHLRASLDTEAAPASEAGTDQRPSAAVEEASACFHDAGPFELAPEDVKRDAWSR